MARYMVLHTYKDLAGYGQFMTPEKAAELALRNAAGEMPARVITTWSPREYGRTDYLFCLWEAESPEDISTVLDAVELSRYLTADIMRVEELSWEELAVQARAAG